MTWHPESPLGSHRGELSRRRHSGTGCRCREFSEIRADSESTINKISNARTVKWSTAPEE